MTGNPIRPNPDDPTEVAWADSVSTHVVRTYATVAARNTDIPTPHAGQVTTIVTAGGGAIVQVWDGTAWRTMPGATTVGYGAFTVLCAHDLGTWVQIPQFANVPITKRGPSGVTRLLVGAWLNGLYSTAGGGGVAVAVGDYGGGALVPVGVGQLQAAPGVSVGGWNVIDKPAGVAGLAVFWMAITNGVRMNAGTSSVSLVAMEIGA